jgi:hypothetical protein
LGIATDQPIVNGSTITPVCPPVVSSFETAHSTAPSRTAISSGDSFFDKVAKTDEYNRGREQVKQAGEEVKRIYDGGVTGLVNGAAAGYKICSFISPAGPVAGIACGAVLGVNGFVVGALGTSVVMDMETFALGGWVMGRGNYMEGAEPIAKFFIGEGTKHYIPIPFVGQALLAAEGFGNMYVFAPERVILDELTGSSNPKPSLQDTLDKFRQVEAGQCDYSGAAGISTGETLTLQSPTVGNDVTVVGFQIENQYSSIQQSISKDKFPSNKSISTWGYSNATNKVSENQGTSLYKPIDSMTFFADGEEKQLFAYGNWNANGNWDSNGAFQCTALVASYLENLGYSDRIGLGNGQDVVRNLMASDLYKDGFIGMDSSIPPSTGSIISMKFGLGGVDDEDGPGHVGIVKGTKQIDDNTLVVTMIEQNIGYPYKSGKASVNRTITFKKDASGNWSARHSLASSGTNTYSVTGWATPV